MPPITAPSHYPSNGDHVIAMEPSASQPAQNPVDRRDKIYLALQTPAQPRSHKTTPITSERWEIFLTTGGGVKSMSGVTALMVDPRLGTCRRGNDRQGRARTVHSSELGRLRWNGLSGGNIRRRCILAQLQCANISHDVPAVTWLNLRRIIGHDSEAVAHHVEEISQRGFLQARGM